MLLVDSAIWAPVVAALGASALTLAGTLGLDWLKRRHQAKDAELERRLLAYEEFLAPLLAFTLFTRSLGEAARFRSGLDESIAVLMGWRKPIEPFDLFDKMNRNMEPLNQAWSKIWLHGSQEAITAANVVVRTCADYMQLTTSLGNSRNPLARTLLGVRRTPSTEREEQAALEKVFEARDAFVDVARREASKQKVVLMTEKDRQPSSFTAGS